MTRTRLFAAATALAALARPLAAQGFDFEDKSQAAYVALSSTPVGGVPRLVTPQALGSARGGGLRFQFGNIDESGDFSRRILLGGIDLPFGGATVGLSAGYLDYRCGNEFEEFGLELECKGGLIAGAHAGTPLLTSLLGTSNAAKVTVGLDGSLGFGTGDILEASFDDGFGTVQRDKAEATSMALGLSLPVAIVARGTGVTVAPHITPGVGYGRLKAKVTTDDGITSRTDEATESGARFMLGGGAAILLDKSGLGLHLGFQKVFVKDGDATLSFGLSYAMR